MLKVDKSNMTYVYDTSSEHVCSFLHVKVLKQDVKLQFSDIQLFAAASIEWTVAFARPWSWSNSEVSKQWIHGHRGDGASAKLCLEKLKVFFKSVGDKWMERLISMSFSGSWMHWDGKIHWQRRWYQSRIADLSVFFRSYVPSTRKERGWRSRWNDAIRRCRWWRCQAARRGGM